MTRRITIALGAVGLFLISVGPAAAAPPEFGCVPPGWKPTGEVVYALGAGPGDPDWVLEGRLCRLQKFDGHIIPIKS
jgi:hypothetical protein